MIIERKLEVEWWCHSRVDTVTEDLLLLMKQAGCVHISYGIESANEDILKSYRKGINLEQCRKVLRISNSLGIKTHCFFIFGNVNETEDTIKESIRFAIELSPTMASFSMLIPYPGTEEFKRIDLNVKDINIWKDFVTVSGAPVTTSKTITKKQIQHYIANAYIQFYARPSQIAKILKSIESIAELRAYVRAGLALMNQIVGWTRLC